MGRKKGKRKKSSIISVLKKVPVYVYIFAGLVVFCIGFVAFLLLNPGPGSIYVFPENPQQGDTVFIRTRGNFGTAQGAFSGPNTMQKIVFNKKGGLQEWFALLGIDADLEPGDYKISLNNGLSKNIKVLLADFSTNPPAKAPGKSQTGFSVQTAFNNIVKSDSPPLKSILGVFTDVPYFSVAFSAPLAKTEKAGYGFGKFISFGDNIMQHFGVDLAASNNTSVYAVNDGKVVATLSLPSYGKTVIIDHGLDIFSLYLHLDQFEVEVGQAVKRGQEIALSGETGYATAPHLHFSIRVGASRVDPLNFIETTKKLTIIFS